MSTLNIENVGLVFAPKRGKSVAALHDVTIQIPPNTFSVIVGPSGCGKSSLLRLVAGLVSPTSGKITLDGDLIVGPAADRGMVFQSYTLFPWLTVQRNVEFGLKLAGVSSDERARTAKAFISQVGLRGFENAYPNQLSGGMMQRVALARAIANNPAILLMDEPFGALDSQTRAVMQELLLEIWQRDRKTVLFITHDIDEAILLGDDVYIMSARPGQIKERIEIDIPRPRSAELVTTEKFITIKKRIRHLIHDEVIRAGL